MHITHTNVYSNTAGCFNLYVRIFCMQKNPKGPDFKHKQTGEALWIESYSSPSWVMSQLDALDKKTKSAGASKSWSDKTSFDEDDLSFF